MGPINDNIIEVREQRNRLRLLAAGVTRFIWVSAGIMLIAQLTIPFANLLAIALYIHFALNIVGLFSFYTSTFTGIATVVLVSFDTIVVCLGILVTGGLSSPFVLILPVIVALTFLLADTIKGYYTTVLATCLYTTIGLVGQLNPELVGLTKIPWYQAVFYLVFNAFSLLSISALLHYMLGKMLDSESRLSKQNQKLSDSLDEISSLKQKQDGDYYLTSLLVDPLAHQIDNVTSANYYIDSFLEQHKKFRFRSREIEIGGDINFATPLTFDKREYLFFANADAMGKSLQGAGGSLVFSTVLTSAIEAQKQKDGTEDFPEQFLISTIRQLQSVFASFNGSMLISTVMGLVDSKTGATFYINAEHPNLILRRDGRVTLLSADFMLPKIGTGMGEAITGLNTLTLLPNDELFVGSDGKDDIELDSQTSSDRKINSDEFYFPRILSDNNGLLPETISAIRATGDTIDDISLLQIRYQPKETTTNSNANSAVNLLLKEAKTKPINERRYFLLKKRKEKRLSTLVSGPRLWIELARTYIRIRNYKRAQRHLLAITKQFPGNIAGAFLLSISYGKLNNPEQAIIWGERVRLREPNHTKNLLHLAQLYKPTRHSQFEQMTHHLERLHLNKQEQNALAVLLN